MEELIKGIKKYIGIIKIAFQVATVLRNLPADAGDLRDTGSDFGLGRPPGGENGTPLQYFCEKKSHGQRRLEGYSSCCPKESDPTEHLSTQSRL